MLAILGVILCVAVQLFLRPMMLLFGATPDVIDYACTYTRITSSDSRSDHHNRRSN